MVYTDSKIYCQSPQCGLEIKDDEMAYSGQGVYHLGDCQRLASVHNSLRSPDFTSFMRFEFINRERALRLLNDGGLEQAVKSEEKAVKAGFLRRFLGILR